MVIDTKEEASIMGKTKTFAIIVYSILVLVTAVFAPVDKQFKFVICGALSVIFVAYYWLQYKMEYTYFYFSNNGRNLIFKYYSLRVLYGKPKTIEIPKSSFDTYDITTGFFNKKESLVLYQKTKKGVAKYPPISLTLLGKNKKTELKRALFAASQEFHDQSKNR
jgi:hypothetical protein